MHDRCPSTCLAGRRLTLGYGHTVVLDDASITVARGITVLLGANGAGKSTLMRALSGALKPTSGSIEVGLESTPVSQRELERLVGVMPQRTQAVSWLTTFEYVLYAAQLAGLKGTMARRAATVALDSVDLSDRDVSTTRLSGGTQRRLGLAAAIVAGSDVLLLDEPTAGLDPIQRDSIHAVIRELGRTKAVLVSTHLVEDLEELADATAVLARGTVAFEGSVDDLRLVGAGGQGRSRIADALRALHGEQPAVAR